MDAHAEPSADVAPGGISVDRRQQPDRVEDEQLFRSVERCGGALRVAQGSAAGFGDEPLDAALVHLVRGDEEFHPGVVVHQADEQLLVGPPGRSGHEQPVVALEALHDIDPLGCPGDLRHAVEARVSGHQHIVEAERGEQFFRLLVLHEHRVERLERPAPHPPVRAEEHGVAAEDGRDDVGADLAAAQLREEVEPEFVLDEDGDLGVCGVEEPACIARGVDRQVEDVVGPGVVLPDLVARRREERDQDLVFGVRPAELFDDRAALLELSERGDMNPDDAVFGSDRFPHPAKQVLATFDPEPGLRVARSHEPDGPDIECESEVIEPHRYLRVLSFSVFSVCRAAFRPRETV